jgi:hypothetical protein
MALANVVRGASLAPVRILVHGADKVGKSTFAMGAPSPVFIGLEGGLEQLGPARFPEPQSFDDVMAAVGELATGAHDHKTLVIDPVNWLEPFIFAKVCDEYGKQNIDEVLGGFQKGQARAVKYWKQLLDALDGLRDKRKMHVVLLAHTAVRNQKNPEAQDWGSWQPSMDKAGAETLKQWVDAIMFARLQASAKQVDGEKKAVKGRSNGARVLLTQSDPAYAAGNRYGLPDQIPLSWESFWEALRKGHGTAEELRKEARALAGVLGSDVLAKCEAYIQAVGDDTNQLAEIINQLNFRAQSA